MYTYLKHQDIARENYEKGIEKGIEILVESYRELNFSDDVIIKKLMEKYNLKEEDARKYI